MRLRLVTARILASQIRHSLANHLSDRLPICMGWGPGIRLTHDVPQSKRAVTVERRLLSERPGRGGNHDLYLGMQSNLVKRRLGLGINPPLPCRIRCDLEAMTLDIGRRHSHNTAQLVENDGNITLMAAQIIMALRPTRWEKSRWQFCDPYSLRSGRHLQDHQLRSGYKRLARIS